MRAANPPRMSRLRCSGVLLGCCALLMAAVGCRPAGDAVQSASASTEDSTRPSVPTTTASTATSSASSTSPATSATTAAQVAAPPTSGGVAVSTTTTFMPPTSTPESTSPPATAGTAPPATATATTAPTPLPAPDGSTVAQLTGIRLGYQGGNVDRVVFDFAGGVPASYAVDYGPSSAPTGGENVILVRMAPAAAAPGYSATSVGGESLNGVRLITGLARSSDAGHELVWAVGVTGRPRFDHVIVTNRVVLNIFP